MSILPAQQICTYISGTVDRILHRQGVRKGGCSIRVNKVASLPACCSEATTRQHAVLANRHRDDCVRLDVVGHHVHCIRCWRRGSWSSRPWTPCGARQGQGAACECEEGLCKEMFGPHSECEKVDRRRSCKTNLELALSIYGTRTRASECLLSKPGPESCGCYINIGPSDQRCMGDRLRS